MKIAKSIDDMLEIQTLGLRMVDKEETTERWWSQRMLNFYLN